MTLSRRGLLRLAGGGAVVVVACGDDEGLGAGATFDALPTYPENFAWFYIDAPPRRPLPS